MFLGYRTPGDVPSSTVKQEPAICPRCGVWVSLLDMTRAPWCWDEFLEEVCGNPGT